jgi:hypothetical protein
MFLAGAVVSNGAVISNFETPTYTAGTHELDSVDGWTRASGAANGGWVTPTGAYIPPTYPILEGSQSWLQYANEQYVRGWGSASSAVGDGSTLSALVRPGTMSAGFVGFYLNATSTTAAPVVGIRMNYDGASSYQFRMANASGGSYAGSFDPTHTYKLELVIDFTNQTAVGWATDVTTSGSPFNIGSIAFAGGSGNVIANGGVQLYTAGGNYPVYDDIQINAVPEPAALSLLGFGGLMMLRRRK